MKDNNIMKAMRSFTERMSNNINQAISQELGNRNVHRSEIVAGKARLVCQSNHNKNGSTTCIYFLEKSDKRTPLLEVDFRSNDYRIIRYSKKKPHKDVIPIMGASSKIIATSEKITATSTPAIVTEPISQEELDIEIEADRLEEIRIEQEQEWLRKNR